VDEPSDLELSADFSHLLFVTYGAFAGSPDAAGDPNIFRTGENPFAEPQWIGEPTIKNPNPPLTKDGDNNSLQPAGGSPDLSTLYFTYFGTLVKEDEPRAGDEFFKKEMEKKITNPTEFTSRTWGFYKWTNGALSSAGVLPNGRTDEFGAVPAAIGQLGHGDATADNFDNQVSTDGSRAFFVSPDPAFCQVHDEVCVEHKDVPELYVRKTTTNGASITALVSQDTLLPKVKETNSEGKAEEYPARAPDGPLTVESPVHPPLPSYVFASPDGSQAFFESADQLTLAAPENNLPKEYDFNVNTESLSYLPEVTDGQGGFAAVLASSQDGSRFIFERQNRSGQPVELDLWSSGQVKSIAELPSPAPNAENKGTLSIAPARSAADGSAFIFETDSPLPDAKNAQGGGPANNGGGWQQIYRYTIGGPDAPSSLTCVSCPRYGMAPSGDARLSEDDNQGRSDTLSGVGLDSPIVGSRGISTDGDRVFFDTPDSLVSQDINDRRDVYEWEEQGAGSCPPVNSGGCVYLISSGIGSHESFFVDNSQSGGDVFFATADALVPSDTDDGYDVYDARVGGGFPQLSVPVGCSGDACQNPSDLMPSLSSPASATFTSGTNFISSTTGAVTRKRAKRPKHKKSKRKVRRFAYHGRAHGKAGRS